MHVPPPACYSTYTYTCTNNPQALHPCRGHTPRYCTSRGAEHLASLQPCRRHNVCFLKCRHHGRHLAHIHAAQNTHTHTNRRWTRPHQRRTWCRASSVRSTVCRPRPSALDSADEGAGRGCVPGAGAAGGGACPAATSAGACAGACAAAAEGCASAAAAAGPGASGSR